MGLAGRFTAIGKRLCIEEEKWSIAMTETALHISTLKASLRTQEV
jgi:hypothetical protein